MFNIILHDPEEDFKVIRKIPVDETECHPAFIGRIILAAVQKGLRVNISNVEQKEAR